MVEFNSIRVTDFQLPYKARHVEFDKNQRQKFWYTMVENNPIEVSEIILYCSTTVPECTDYGGQMKPFFIDISNFWAWADILGK